ncbi:hypothetical protein [Parahaliea mediterranea]|uniref:Curli production assembly/transport component CsgF n=1 Tax=Parahaliea mediterranea TaxID=651086 RepID=A0A939DFY0_9GAMM|nr:hypothetical protein [Parahaliea mediterranea]MBN7797479.1 hypothetical protein [Parahaliea mediterranea]
MLTFRCTRAGIGACALCLLPAGVAAESIAMDSNEAPPSPSPLFAVAAVSAGELDANRGREGLDIDELVMQLNDVRADASVANNVLNSQSTGGNLVEAGAFSNAAGLVFNVQNSGNHVVIQNTTLINVNLEP